jgi:hypothetical protein
MPSDITLANRRGRALVVGDRADGDVAIRDGADHPVVLGDGEHAEVAVSHLLRRFADRAVRRHKLHVAAHHVLQSLHGHLLWGLVLHPVRPGPGGGVRGRFWLETVWS